MSPEREVGLAEQLEIDKLQAQDVPDVQYLYPASSTI